LWQVRPGAQGDRDLAFFDAMFSWVRENYQVDTNRVYATGHSNGGMFTYLLWETRGSILRGDPALGFSLIPGLRVVKTSGRMHYEGRDSRREKRRKAKRNLVLILLTGLVGALVVAYAVYSINTDSFNRESRFMDLHSQRR
jgi:hypothetical protein